MDSEALTKSNKFDWTEKRLAVAEVLSKGNRQVTAASEKCKVSRQTIHEWLKNPEFKARIDDLTMKSYRHTAAGMIRELDDKMKKTDVGEKDWYKLNEQKIKLLGLEKHKVEHSGGVGICIVDDVPKE